MKFEDTKLIDSLQADLTAVDTQLFDLARQRDFLAAKLAAVLGDLRKGFAAANIQSKGSFEEVGAAMDAEAAVENEGAAEAAVAEMAAVKP
jgi:hypothetical protein